MGFCGLGPRGGGFASGAEVDVPGDSEAPRRVAAPFDTPCTGRSARRTAGVPPARRWPVPRLGHHPSCHMPELSPHTAPVPPPYLGEQCGTLQWGLHQPVQGEEELLQRALELGRLLPLVEPATARVTAPPPRHTPSPGTGHTGRLCSGITRDPA